jgi:hypothetical protein
MIKWKWITARSVAFYAANETVEGSIQALIKKSLEEGWFLKGEMRQVYPNAEIWVQRMGKSFPVQN